MPISTSSSWSQLLPMDTSSPHHVSMGLGPGATKGHRKKLNTNKWLYMVLLLIFFTSYREILSSATLPKEFQGQPGLLIDLTLIYSSDIIQNIVCLWVCLPDLCWLPHPGPDSLLPLLGSSQLELVSMGFPQADVPLSTVTGGAVVGSPHVEDSFCWGKGSPQPGGKRKVPIRTSIYTFCN